MKGYMDIVRVHSTSTSERSAQQMRVYIKEALMSGILVKDVRTMVADNPARILDI
jgi:hypothetical protein